MTASFPSSVKTWNDKQDNIDDVFAGDINGAYAEIKAIETELMQVGYKRSVRAATTQNGALATAFANGQTIDGVVLVTGDRILIKDQTNGAENGIYTVNASGAPTRAADASSAAHMVAGLMVYVREGTVNAKGAWKLTTDGTITLGTTPLTFENELRAHEAEKAKLHPNTGSANALAFITGGDFQYTDGNWLMIKLSAPNTTVVTVNVDTKGVRSLRNPDGTELVAGDIETIHMIAYDATNDFFVLRPSGAKLGEIITAIEAKGGTVAEPQKLRDVVDAVNNVSQWMNTGQKRWMNGTGAGNTNSVRGLNFQPKTIIIHASNGSYRYQLTYVSELKNNNIFKGMREQAYSDATNPMISNIIGWTIYPDGFSFTVSGSSTPYAEPWDWLAIE